MKVIITENKEELATEALKVMLSVVKNNDKAILGLATGSSPIGLYKAMINDCKQNGTSYKNIKTVNLDEYVGLGIESDQSYVYFMRDNLFNGLDINLANTQLPDGTAKNMQDECARYTALLSTMRQDIQLLGIGGNGHIGFNEPGTPFASTTHIVELQQNTIKDNARFFDNDISKVPTHAITMGIKNIMDAKMILVVASGDNKAQAVYDMIHGKIAESCPASVLRKHDNVVVVVDKAAAKLIINKI